MAAHFSVEGKKPGELGRAAEGEKPGKLEKLLSFTPRSVLLVAPAALLLWAPYAFAFFPGIVEIDTIFQIGIHKGYWTYTALWPLGTTTLFGALFDLGETVFGCQTGGIAVILAAQTVSLALALAATVCYLGRWGVGAKARLALFLATTLVPTSCLQAVDLGKDAAYSVPFLVFALSSAECLRTDGASLRRPAWLAAHALAAALMVAFRSSGLLVVGVTTVFVACSLLHRRHNAARAAGAPPVRGGLGLACALLCAPLVAALCSSALCSAFLSSHDAVTGHGKREALGPAMQMATQAVIDDPEGITDEEYAALRAFYGLDEAVANFQPAMTDNVKAQCPLDVSNEATLGFLKAWASIGLRHPASYLKAAWHLYSGWVTVGDFDSLALPRFILSEESKAALGTSFGDGVDLTGDAIATTRALVDFRSSFSFNYLPEFNAEHPDFGDWGQAEATFGLRRAIFMGIAYLGSVPVLGVVLSKSLYAFYLPLVCIILWARRRREAPISVLVPLGAMAVLAFVGPVDLTRYITPSLFVMPLSLGIVAFGRRGPGR